MEGSVKAYRSGGKFYYFNDGQLVRIDEGLLPAQRIQMEFRSDQKLSVSGTPDMYEELRKLEELRKTGVLTEEEFSAQKQRILGRQK